MPAYVLLVMIAAFMIAAPMGALMWIIVFQQFGKCL